MDRYSILLGKRYDYHKSFWNSKEHSWEYQSRLRFLVVGDRGMGKTSYLISDALKTSSCGVKSLFVCENYTSIQHLKRLMVDYKLLYQDVCSWAEFDSKDMMRGQHYRSVYFDDGDMFNIEGDGSPLLDLMFLGQNRLFNIPRIIISASSFNVITIPKGNWEWKIENIKHFRRL